MSKVYGYCRISTKQQSIARQIRNIKEAYPTAVITEEVFTGTQTTERKIFTKLMNTAKAGDTIVFDSVSRMSRNAKEGFELYQNFFKQGIELVFLKEPHINTATYKEAIDKQMSISCNINDAAAEKLIQDIMSAINAYMMRLAEKQIYLAFEQAEKEVNDLHQRTKEGIETARLAGKQIGQVRGKKLNVKKAAPAKEIIKKYSETFGGSLDDTHCIALTQLSHNTYYKYKRELREELAALAAESVM